MKNELAKRLLSYNTDDNLFLSRLLFKCLLKIEDFYYSDFWINRLKRRMYREGISANINKILHQISKVLDGIVFRIEDEDILINGSSKGHTIYINQNMAENEVNDSHLHNLVVHESGHLIYNDVDIISDLNESIFKNPKDYILKELNPIDYKYFTDTNELRLRIFPVIMEMYLNGWDVEDTYFKSPNLIQDNIYKLYPKRYIMYLLKNII